MTNTRTNLFFALGTANSVSVPADAGEHVLRLAQERVTELNNRLSVFREDSEISRVNEAAGRRFVEVHPDTLTLVRASVRYSELTGGVFDLTARPLVALWGIGKKEKFIPSPQEIEQARALVNFRDILIREKNNALMLRRPGQALDLGAIAKGYAADEVRKLLFAQGVSDALVNLGGTVVAMGRPREVGIQHPWKPTGTVLGKLRVKDQAVVTSGFYEKYFLRDGIRYHHILDPRTGYPSDSGLAGVTLIGGSAMELDALATAIFILGPEKGAALLQRCGAEAIFITQSGDVMTTNGLKNEFTLLSPTGGERNEEGA